jgi:hypothetical protein
MIPGELITDAGELPLNPGRRTATVVVENASDRPVQARPSASSRASCARSSWWITPATGWSSDSVASCKEGSEWLRR